ncbi:glycogenin-2 isoform X1 [Podarcis lilfordi]|nr:glycogenin-2 isoform X1 [Podarcis lilfordi]
MHLALLERLELGVTFTKLHCWTLTQYSKCVFMDADTLVLCNIDELFDREELSAAPDSGWPDCFNSGVFVFKPSLKTYNLLLQFANEHGSFDGGDQGLLNSFFSNWATTDINKHLPFLYNLSSSVVYTYAPAFQYFGKDTKVVHFLGPSKPWNYKYNPQTGTVIEDSSSSLSNSQLCFLQLWWTTYSSDVLPLLEKTQESSEPQIQREESVQKAEGSLEVHIAEPSESSPEPTFNPTPQETVKMDDVTSSVSELCIQPNPEVLSAEDERRKWEEGHIDYLGKDAFENIKKKLDSFLL